jgi:hypothetical protein
MKIEVDSETLERIEARKKKQAEIKEKITKERLLELCFEMHKWIFLHTGDEQEVYDKIGFTEEENFLFGYSGQMSIRD